MSVIYLGNGKWREIGRELGYTPQQFTAIRNGFLSHQLRRLRPPTDKRHRYGGHMSHMLAVVPFTQAMLRIALVQTARVAGIPFRIESDGSVIFGHYPSGTCWNCPNKHWRL